MIQRFTVEGRLMGLNEYTKANRANAYAGAKAKKSETARVAKAAEGLHPMRCPIAATPTWYEAPAANGRMRDKDNIAFAAKFVFDGLVKAGVIPDDKWDNIDRYGNVFRRAKAGEGRVEIELRELIPMEGE